MVFQTREQLLEELLGYWVDTSTVLFERILQTNGHNGMQEYIALIDLWVDEKEYDPRWDAAVLERVFQDMGYRGTEAHIRARIT